MKTTAVVSEKGQVTIPKALRKRLGLRTGQVLEFRVEGGALLAVKAGSADPVKAVYGVLGLRGGTDAAMRRLRGTPDAT